MGPDLFRCPGSRPALPDQIRASPSTPGWRVVALPSPTIYFTSTFSPTFSRCGTQIGSIHTSWEPVRNANSQVPPLNKRVKIWREGRSPLCLNKPSRRFWCMLKVENHWPVHLTLEVNLAMCLGRSVAQCSCNALPPPWPSSFLERFLKSSV